MRTIISFLLLICWTGLSDGAENGGKTLTAADIWRSDHLIIDLHQHIRVRSTTVRSCPRQLVPEAMMED